MLNWEAVFAESLPERIAQGDIIPEKFASQNRLFRRTSESSSPRGKRSAVTSIHSDYSRLSSVIPARPGRVG